LSIFEESESYRPFKYPYLVEATKKHLIDLHWHEGQIDLQSDLTQYNTEGGLSTPNVSHEVNKQFFDTVVCLFTELDKTVAGGYVKLLSCVGNNEARSWFLAAASRETTHQRSYALAAETFGFPESSWTVFKEYTEMQDKIDLMSGDEDDLEPCLNRAKLLARILLGEGIGLFAAFAGLLNFRRTGHFMGFNDVNEWSLRDENEHVKFNMRCLEEMRKELTEVENLELDRFIKALVQSYVEAEHKFIDLATVKGELEDLTNQQLKDYITYLGKFREFQLNLVSYEEVPENPLEWME